MKEGNAKTDSLEKVAASTALAILSFIVPPGCTAFEPNGTGDRPVVVFDRPKFSPIKSGMDPFVGPNDPTLEALPADDIRPGPEVPPLPEEIQPCKTVPPSGDEVSRQDEPPPGFHQGKIGRDCQNHLDKAEKLAKKAQWRQAIAQAERALSLDPAHARIREILCRYYVDFAETLVRQNNYVAACEQLRHALYVDPLSQRASDHLDRCLREWRGQDPRNYSYRQKLAEDLELDGNLEAAIVEYRQCLGIKDNPVDRAALGWTLSKYELPVEALVELKKALAVSWPEGTRKEKADCYRNLGDILWSAALIAEEKAAQQIYCRRASNAYAAYRRATRLSPSGSAAKKLTEVSKAAAAANPTFANLLAAGGAELLAGDIAGARSLYAQCRALNPSNPDLARATSALARRVALAADAAPQDISNCLNQVEASLDANPRDAQTWYIFGRLKERLGQHAQALDAYRQAEELDPETDPDLASAIARCAKER